ncbi:hypothetical protein [uncultured Mediterranean phage uvMED]|nr:hypothetical protein [uncultured Mediterranean phage uvMED]
MSKLKEIGNKLFKEEKLELSMEVELAKSDERDKIERAYEEVRKEAASIIDSRRKAHKKLSKNVSSMKNELKSLSAKISTYSRQARELLGMKPEDAPVIKRLMKEEQDSKKQLKWATDMVNELKV